MATRSKNLYDVARRLEDRVAGRDQEGLPQARPPVPPGHEPGRQGGRGALQGGPGRLRRALGSREAQAVRRIRLGGRPRRLSRRGRQRRQLQLRLRRHLRPLRRLRRHLRRARPGARARGPRRGSPGRGRPVVRGLAARVETQIPVEAEAACRDCGGSGAEPGTSPQICPECKGRGVTVESQGMFGLSQPCPRCHGNGTVIEKPCPRCQGSGRERRTKRYKVKIPAGVKDGTQIRLKGKGEPGYGGGPPGDLIVVTRVADSPLYKRRGSDLEVEVPVTFADAALGASVDVPTPEGPVSLKVPAGSRERQAPADPGPRRAEAQRRRQGRRARAPEDLRPEEAEQEGARASRAAPEGAEDDDRRPAPLHDQRRRRARRHAPADVADVRGKGLVNPQRTAGNTRLYSEADLERLRLIQQLTTELGPEPRRRRARDPARGADAPACSARWSGSSARCASRSPRCTASTGATSFPTTPRTPD